MLTSNRNPTNENQPEKTCERVATKVKAYMNIRISVCLLLLLQFAFWNCNPTWVSGTVPHHPRYHHTLKSLKGLNKMAATGCCLENCEPPISQASSCLTAIKYIYINTTAISRHPSLETTLKNAVEVLPRRTAQEFQPGCWSHGANQSHHGTQHEKRW